MDKILSARIDETVLNYISQLANTLHISKKKIIEDAIKKYANNLKAEQTLRPFKQSFGLWKSKEAPSETAGRIRREFQKSMLRHQ